MIDLLEFFRRQLSFIGARGAETNACRPCVLPTGQSTWRRALAVLAKGAGTIGTGKPGGWGREQRLNRGVDLGAASFAILAKGADFLFRLFCRSQL